MKVHHFSKMLVDDKIIYAQKGKVIEYVTAIAYWIGTQPTEEELKPQHRIRIEVDRILVKNIVDLPSLPTITIECTDGHTFVATDLTFFGMVHYSERHASMEYPNIAFKSCERVME